MKGEQVVGRENQGKVFSLFSTVVQEEKSGHETRFKSLFKLGPLISY